jgi:hypothetical protein
LAVIKTKIKVRTETSPCFNPPRYNWEKIWKKKKTLSEEFRGFGEEVESEIFREEKVRY